MLRVDCLNTNWEEKITHLVSRESKNKTIPTLWKNIVLSNFEKLSE